MKKQEDGGAVANEEEIIYKENEGMTAVDNSEGFTEVRKEVGSVMEFNKLIMN
jgi:hypothetical protein